MDNTKFISNVITKLYGKVAEDELETIRVCLIEELENYDIKFVGKEIVPYESFIPSFYQTYFVTKKMEGKSMQTLKMYHFYLTKFFNLIQKPVESITSDTIRLFLYRYQEMTGISSRTLDSVRACLSAFFSWASSEGYIKVNPMTSIQPIKYEKKLRGYLEPIEVEAMRNACINSREIALLEFFCSTGCRVSEVVGVKISDVNIALKECDVLGKGNKHRKVYISPKCELALNKYLKETGRDFNSEGYLFINERNTKYNHVSKESLERIVKDIATRAKIEKNVFPHLLRHTVATQSIQKGMSVQQVQRLLGHSSIATTTIYAHISDSDVKYNYLKAVV